jgi:futalosine hydrolase
MKILLVAATRAEISILLEHFNLTDGNFITSENFDVLITGVGMTATAFALGVL